MILKKDGVLRKVENIFAQWTTLVAVEGRDGEKNLVVVGLGRKGKGTEFLWYPRYETLAGVIKLLMSLYGVDSVLTDLDLNIEPVKPKPLRRKKK